MKIISVDFQKEFTHPEGKCYSVRHSVRFVKNVLIPEIRERGIKIAEIISDYRQPRPGDPRDICHPGEEWYESEIPDDVKHKDVWVKCMNSPIWTRENIGLSERNPGLPYPDPQAFYDWVEMIVGGIGKTVVLIGLTLDRCVLATAQELTYKGYKVRILKEGVDTASGSEREKEYLLNHPPITYWAEPLTWEELLLFL